MELPRLLEELPGVEAGRKETGPAKEPQKIMEKTYLGEEELNRRKNDVSTRERTKGTTR